MKIVTRQMVADRLKADGEKGYRNGTSYPGASPNKYCKYFGFGTTFSCAFGVSWAFATAALPLPSMESGINHGYFNCVEGMKYCRDHDALKHSWEGEVADFIFVNTGSGSQPGHTELIYAVVGSGRDRKIYTAGADSGPSNVNGYKGQGGTHLHVWDVPEGVGNESIMGAGDAGKLVNFGGVAKPKPKRKVRHYHPVQKDHHGKVTVVPSELRPHQRTLWHKLLVAVAKHEGKVKK